MFGKPDDLGQKLVSTFSVHDSTPTQASPHNPSCVAMCCMSCIGVFFQEKKIFERSEKWLKYSLRLNALTVTVGVAIMFALSVKTGSFLILTGLAIGVLAFLVRGISVITQGISEEISNKGSREGIELPSITPNNTQ